MKIEFLFPDLCTLYGDRGNFEYLKKCLPKSKFIYTTLNDEPNFDVSLIYMGSMTEKSQEKAIKKLMPYKEKIKELINNNVIFILTGNSFEIFNNYILDGDNKIEGLGIINLYSKRIIPNRFNSLFLGKFNNYNIVGYTSRFSHTYGEFNNYLFEVKKGKGLNLESKYEGVRINNLFATYLLGPVLIQNPKFTEYIIKLLNKQNKLYIKKELMDAYNIRIKELEKL